MNLLVMENLFYDRRFSKVRAILWRLSHKLTLLLQIYDLKGSTRNRHVQSTGRENEVLLDENLVESGSHYQSVAFCILRSLLLAAHLAPFYLREHSKRILRGALYNDSKFLAEINVNGTPSTTASPSKKTHVSLSVPREKSKSRSRSPAR